MTKKAFIIKKTSIYYDAEKDNEEDYLEVIAVCDNELDVGKITKKFNKVQIEQVTMNTLIKNWR